jgi:predicted PurR-regulated permease PerM
MKLNFNYPSSAAKLKPSLKVVTYFLLVLLFVYLSWVLVAPFASAVLLAAVSTLIGRPFFKKLNHLGLSRTLSAALVTTLLIVLFVGPVSTFAVLAIKDAQTYMASSGEAHKFIIEGSQKLLSGIPKWMTAQLNWTSIQNQLNDVVKHVLNIVLNAASSLPNTLLQFAIASLTLFFFLKDGPTLMRWVLKTIPFDPRVVKTLKETTYDTTLSAFSASFWTAAAQSLLVFFAFYSLSIPGQFLAAGAAFIFAWIPLLGTAPVVVLGLIYLASQTLWTKFVILCVLGLVIGVSDNAIRAVLLKGDKGLHPMIGLLSVLGGIEVFGILGVILGPIIATLSIALLKIGPEVMEKFHKDEISENEPKIKIVSP